MVVGCCLVCWVCLLVVDVLFVCFFWVWNVLQVGCYISVFFCWLRFVCMFVILIVLIIFQGLIQILNQFWVQQGCVFIQLFDLEVGVGIFYLVIFLWVIGLESWNVVYVQLLCCLIDGCYGENLNCLQCYYQYQVVMKLVLDNIQ